MFLIILFILIVNRCNSASFFGTTLAARPSTCLQQPCLWPGLTITVLSAELAVTNLAICQEMSNALKDAQYVNDMQFVENSDIFQSGCTYDSNTIIFCKNCTGQKGTKLTVELTYPNSNPLYQKIYKDLFLQYSYII